MPVLLRDVAEVRDVGKVRVLERVSLRVLDVPLAADVLHDGRELEILGHVEEEGLFWRQRGLRLYGQFHYLSAGAELSGTEARYGGGHGHLQRTGGRERGAGVEGY